MIGLYTKESFEKEFWDRWYWGHIDQYHINQDKSSLEDRLFKENKPACSTFINDDEHDGDIQEYLLQQFLKHLEEINKFLSLRCDNKRLYFYAPIPQDIGSYWLSITGKEQSPRSAIFVISKDCGTISGITAYPFSRW